MNSSNSGSPNIKHERAAEQTHPGRRNRRVFISATTRDLEEQRASAREIAYQYGCEVSEMSDWPADDHPAEEYIRTQIRASDIFVLIAAGLYGDMLENEISYTELEYNIAKQFGLHVIVFIRDQRFWGAEYIESEAALGEKLHRFHRRLRRENTHKQWRQTEDLRDHMRRSLGYATRPVTIVSNNWELTAELQRHITERELLGTPAKSAQVIQFSGENAKGIVATLLNAGVNVKVYLGALECALQLKNKHQEDLIRKNRYVKFLNTALPNGKKPNCGNFELFRYNAPACIRAVVIDDTLVAIGTYVYMQKPVGDQNETVLDIRGGEMPMFVVQSGHPRFTVMLDMIRDLLKNWRKHDVAKRCNKQDLQIPSNTKAASAGI